MTYASGYGQKDINLEPEIPAGGDDAFVGVKLVTDTTQTSYPTIGDALAAANSGDVVFVGPGDYAESFTIPTGVTVRGNARASATVSGAAATGTRITLGAQARLENIFVEAASDGTPAVLASSPGSVIPNLTILGGGATSVGLRVTAAGVLCNALAARGNFDVVCEVTAAALAGIEKINLVTGGVNTILQTEGNTQIGAIRTLSSTCIVTDAVLINGGTLYSDADLMLEGTVVNGYHITADDAVVLLNAPFLDRTNVTTTFLIDPGVTTGTLVSSGGRFSRDSIVGPDAYLQQDTVTLAFIDEKPGDEGFVIIGELTQGQPYSGQGAAFGEGNSYTRDMVILRENAGGGTFTNITSDLLLPDGTSVALFDTGAINERLCIGSQYSFVSFASLITTALAPGVSTVLTFEVSDGIGGWNAVPMMASDASEPFDQYAQALFQRINDEQNRWGIDQVSQGAQDVDGITRNWLRVTITGDPLAVVPEADQIRIGPNRTESSDRGFFESFGLAEKTITLPVRRFGLQGASPGNARFDVAAGLSMRVAESRFASGALDGFVSSAVVRRGTDTSRQFSYVFSWKPTTAAAGNVDFLFDVGVYPEGTVYNGALPLDFSTTLSVPTNSTAEEQFNESISFTLPDAIPEEYALFLFLRRDGAADSYG